MVGRIHREGRRVWSILKKKRHVDCHMGVVASVYGKGVFVYLYSIYKKKAAAQDKGGLFTFLAENNITLWKGKMTSHIKRKKEEQDGA